MKRRPAVKATKSAAPKKIAKAAKPAAPKKTAALKKTAAPKKTAQAKKAATKTSPDAQRRAALEATGLAEKVLQGRDIQADVGLEVKKNAFYAVVRVRVEDLPALLG